MSAQTITVRAPEAACPAWCKGWHFDRGRPRHNHRAEIPLTLQQPKDVLDWGDDVEPPAGGAWPSYLTVEVPQEDWDECEDRTPKVGLWRLFDNGKGYFNSTHVDLTPVEARYLAEALLHAVEQVEGR